MISWLSLWCSLNLITYLDMKRKIIKIIHCVVSMMSVTCTSLLYLHSIEVWVFFHHPSISVVCCCLWFNVRPLIISNKLQWSFDKFLLLDHLHFSHLCLQKFQLHEGESVYYYLFIIIFIIIVKRCYSV